MGEDYIVSLSRRLVGRAKIITMSPSGYRFPNHITTTIEDVYYDGGTPVALVLKDDRIIPWHIVLCIESLDEDEGGEDDDYVAV
jgi:hypothetical protein